MADGKTHDRWIVYGTVFGTTVLVFWGQPLHVTFWFTVGHLFGGFYLSPDLDLISRPTKRWQRLGLGWYWSLYRRLPHRSWVSHCPFIGTLGRVVYLGLPVISLVTFFGIPINWELLADWGFPALIGIELSELNHLFLDYR